MFPIAGIDPLRTVAAEEIPVEEKTAVPLQHRHALLFGTARVNRALVNHDRPRTHHFADRLAGPAERTEIRLFVLVHRRGNSHDEEIAITESLRIGGVTQPDRRLQRLRRTLQRGVAAASQLLQTRLLDVESDGIIFPAELHRERQPHISEADHRDSGLPTANFFKHCNSLSDLSRNCAAGKFLSGITAVSPQDGDAASGG